MPTLKLRFPGGRYHATPWGHHVNEGLIEWPPSPWRLLRALIACGFATQQWREVPPLATSLIDKLADVLPSYCLPKVTAAHSRHFMPIGELGKGREKTTLVWDTFANVGDGQMLVHWPCELNSDETAMVAQLAHNLNYLGRSESWVEAELIPDSQVDLNSFDAVPHQEYEQRGQKYEQISLMAPIPPDSYKAWQQEMAKEAVAHLELPAGKKKPTAKLLKDREREQAPYPRDLVACLTKDTSWWKGHGWGQPPGSQRVLYWRPSQPMQVTAPPRRHLHKLPRAEMMLLALTTPSGNKSALPSITRTLPQAELFHRAIVGRAGKGDRVHCPELTGKDEQGRPLQAGHHHAHILSLDLDGDRRIDHILIYAKMGLGDTAQHAIAGLRRTWTKGGTGDLQLAVVGKGSLDDLRQLPGMLSTRIQRILGPSGLARSWVSLTPFIPPRFEKRLGKKNDVANQVNAELRSRGLPEATVTIQPWNLAETAALRHYIRCRRQGKLPPQDIGYPLKLTFAEPVAGPIALGYASHFGMGLFAAEGLS
jgi:CRISPR-associated protein Csb2